MQTVQSLVRHNQRYNRTRGKYANDYRYTTEYVELQIKIEKQQNNHLNLSPQYLNSCNHLEKFNEIDDKGKIKERPDLAFSEDGIVEMNKYIQELNGGKKHQPIYKARVYETLGNKFAVGQTGNKKDKYVEAAKGTNLFFAV